ncbi:MAG: hypothetical protein JXR77_02025 [Lentisphaeria bacterium]|nr:hypothetical protein [Lentisphaeria bacterium]
MHRPVTFLCFVLLLAASGPGSPAADPGNVLESLAIRRRELGLQLVAEKARILREDPQAAELRERIERLYLQLDELVASNPAVRRLEAELLELDRATRAARAGAGPAPAEKEPRQP